jgi:hypothetical protein
MTGDVILAWLTAVAGFCELTIGLWASKLVSPGAKRRQSSVGDREFVVAPFVAGYVWCRFIDVFAGERSITLSVSDDWLMKS